MTNKELSESLKDLVNMAYLAGKTDARNQVLTLIKSLLEKPNYDSMTNTEVVRWISEAIALEFKVDLPSKNE